MTTPNWDRTFTHSVEIRQFRTEQGAKDYRAIIDNLLDKGGSFAVSAGRLWLSDFSLKASQDLSQIILRKDPMTSLSQAESLADAIDTAKQQFEAYMRPTLQDYIDFTSEHVRAQAPTRFKNAEDFSFKEIDTNLFVFESEEFIYYGDHIADVVEIPFTFVHNPEKYKADLIQSIRDAEALRLVKSVAAAQDRVTKLKKDLADAEAILARTTSTD